MNSTTTEDGMLQNLDLSFGHYKFKRPNNDVSRRGIRRLLLRAGCKRITKTALIQIPSVLRQFLKSCILKAIDICRLKKRKTVSLMDVLYALKVNNITFLI